MAPVPDLVRISKLDTQFYSSPEYTEHVQYVSSGTLERRKVRREERWKKERILGGGSFGVVWLEQCFQGESEGAVRAVKKVQKLEGNNYNRELEAIALFSHSKYEQCFVKSSGWYDDDDSIFIAMEYLPYGDLHKYLGSPLPEGEAQHIVSQVLEGLDFMHQNGFAHRDLKPANILVVCEPPAWWVKIADFGISKRATEELTALRTLTGTPAFAAPEVLGFTQSDSYTNAVDIWSLGVITFLILTGETLFKDQRRLGQFVAGRFAFPLGTLLANKVTRQGCEFVRSMMAPEPEDRPGAKESLHNSWLETLPVLAATERPRIIDPSRPPEAMSHYSIPEASASWSTRDLNPTPLPQSSANKHYSIPEASASWSTQDLSSTPLPQSSADERAKKTDHKFSTLLSTEDEILPAKLYNPSNVFAEPNSEARIQAYTELSTALKGHSNYVNAVAFSPDGRLIASGSYDKTVRLWDSATGAARATLQGHSSSVHAVAFSPDGGLIASRSNDKTVRLWDSATGAARATLLGHSGYVYVVVFSPDGKLIASGSGDKTVRLWDPATGAACATLEGHSSYIVAVTFSPDGKLIASGSGDKTVRLWDPATGAACATLEGHSSYIVAVTFSPDGKLIASGSGDKTVRLWDPATGAACATLEGHSSYIVAVTFSPDGKLIASGSGDKTVRLWDPATGAACATLEGHSSYIGAVTFSPDGKLIASGSGDNTVRLWDPATGAACATLEGHSSSVYAVAFSPDGKLIASGSGDKTVSLWDPATGAACATLEGHSSSVYAVAFSPDGKLIASGSTDMTVRLWGSATAKEAIAKGATAEEVTVKYKPAHKATKKDKAAPKATKKDKPAHKATKKDKPFLKYFEKLSFG